MIRIGEAVLLRVVTSSGKQVIALGILAAVLVAPFYGSMLVRCIRRRRLPASPEEEYVSLQKIKSFLMRIYQRSGIHQTATIIISPPNILLAIATNELRDYCRWYGSSCYHYYFY